MTNNQSVALNDYRILIETQLDCFLKEQPSLNQAIIIDAMRYSLLGGGKRIRGILTLEICRAISGDYKKAIIPACAVEMIHAYSLIHDDLPCMDDDDMRRGKATSHKQYGEAIAVLAGDGLLTLAFKILSSEQAEETLTAKKAIECVRALSTASGEYGMLGGQVLDMQGENSKMTQQQLTDMVSLKTGALIKAAVKCGCIVSDANEEQEKTAMEFAERLGVAFQMTDDLLDITANKKILGKPTLSDCKNNKNTFITVYGMKETENLICRYHKEATELLKKLSFDCELLAFLTDSLANRRY